jgi:hypothetical protein
MLSNLHCEAQVKKDHLRYRIERDRNKIILSTEISVM